MSFASLRYPMNPLGNQRLRMGCNLNETITLAHHRLVSY